MINWKVRICNPRFWLGLVPALLLAVQAVAALWGISLNLTELQERLLAAVNAIFALLAALGVVNDPTTAGCTDSTRALTYTRPSRE